jgi:hypothetical protein
VPAVASAAAAGTTIVVNAGPFPTVEAAAHGEEKVNWLDADPADDIACTECFAALELQHYLRKITGRADDFPTHSFDAPFDGPAPEEAIVITSMAGLRARKRPVGLAINVEPLKLEALGPEAYHIHTASEQGGRITTIFGVGRLGALYGVYDLLHRLGCRWFAPGDSHEEIPSLKLDRLPDFDVTERPAFATRGFHAWEDRGNPAFIVWMARNRLNYWCVEQGGHPFLHKLGIRMAGAAHDAQSLFLNPASPYPYNHPRFDGDEAKPKDPYPLSDQFQGDAGKDGKLSTFEAHPEWFALEGGKRVPGIRGDGGTNFCTSNPHAVAEFMRSFVQAIAEGRYRDANVIRFWTLDGGKWCTCEPCKALGIPTDRNLLLVRRLDEEIKKARAAGKINRPIAMEFLAYADVLQPPTRPLPADFDYQTCYSTFYPIVRCYVHRFDDPACATNARYAKQLQGWVADPARHFTGQLCIGEYYNVSGHKCLPICFMRTMANDIPFYHKVGARHFHYMHATTGNWGTKALTNYQMARQLWDPKTDCEKLWEDYFVRRYGPAAPTMRRFYESLEKMLSSVSELKYGLARRLNAGAKDLFPNSHLRLRREPGLQCDGPTLEEIVAAAKECRALIAQAVGGVSSPRDAQPGSAPSGAEGAAVPHEQAERIKARIAEDERLFAYGERTVLYFHECAQAFTLARAGQPDDARRHLAEAQRLAALLRQDTASTKLSSSHANSPDALTASFAAGALDHIGKLLAPPK